MTSIILALVAFIAGNVTMISIEIGKIASLLEEIADQLRGTGRLNGNPVPGSRYQQKRAGGE